MKSGYETSQKNVKSSRKGTHTPPWQQTAGLSREALWKSYVLSGWSHPLSISAWPV